MSKRKHTVKQGKLLPGTIEKFKANVCSYFVTEHMVNVFGYFICRIMLNRVDAYHLQKDVWQPYLAKYP